MLWHSGLMIQLVSVEVLVLSLSWHSGLRMQCCRSCGIGCKSSPDLIYGPETSICNNNRKKQTKKKTKTKKKKKEKKFEWKFKYMLKNKTDTQAYQKIWGKGIF